MKKLNTLMQGAVGLMALGAVAVHAQEIQTVEVEGTVDSWWNNYQQVNPELLNAATFKFTVEQDIAVSPSYVYTGSSYEEKNYSNNVYRLSYTFYDAQGVEIQTTTKTELVSGDLDQTYVWARNETNENYYYDYMQWWGQDYNNMSGESYSLGGYFYQNSTQIEMFSDFSGYPLLFDTQDPGYYFYGWLYDSNESSYYNEFWGSVTSIISYYPDDDEDGYPNNVDSCVMSDMSETVMFDGWYDSGVTNYVDSSGCTVIDHYAACDAEEEPERGIRSTRSGPSNCEKAVSYDLVADGVISYSEARMLRNALNTVN